MKHLQARAIPLPEWRGVALLLRDEKTGAQLAHDSEGRPEYRTPRNDVYDPPLVLLYDDDAQILANSLWDAGYRPEGARASTGQLGAVQAHLEDMRAMAFQGLKLQKPAS